MKVCLFDRYILHTMLMVVKTRGTIGAHTRRPGAAATARTTAHRKGPTVDDIRIAQPPRTTKDPKARLARLEEKCRHELMDPDARLELRESISRLRRKLVL
jgi:hypothetical protein